MGTDKKTYNVAGVQLSASRSMDQVAKELSEKMNALTDDGYSVQVLSVDEGLLVVGRLRSDDRESPIARLLGALSQSSDGEEIPDRVASLLASIREKIPGDWDTSFENEMPKVLPLVLKGAPLHVISEVAQECDDCAAKHEKSHTTSGDDCSLPRFLRAMAKGMREYASQNVS